VTLPASTEPLWRAPAPGRPRHRRLPYSPALDGIRGAAVIAVLLFHGGLSWAKGGFLGVDAFFVLSGFLITSLLVQEWRDEGFVNLGAFWARRARRLLPALIAVVIGTAWFAAAVAPPDARHSLRLDGLATLGYVANWRFVASGATYFGRAELPSPLRHTWSLAIEEQFYLLWPLAVTALFRRRLSLRALAALSAGLAAASAFLMAVLVHPGGDPSRVYFGTDTHGQSLLIGAALAFLLASRAGGARAPVPAAVHAAALPSGVGLVAMWALTSGNDAWLYRGGFLVAGLAVAVVIASVTTAPGSLARALTAEPLVVIGRMSYGLYLYHWPIYLTLNGERTHVHGPLLLLVRLAATAVVAALSYRFLELPVRRGALKGVRLAAALPAAALAAAAVLVAATANTGASSTTLAAAQHTQAPAPAAQTPTQSRPSRAIGHPVKVMLIGDSLAKSLGWGLTGQAPKLDAKVTDESTLGCGIARGTPYKDQDRTPAQPPQCATWPEQWQQSVDRVDPDVAILLFGRWEIMDRFHDGAWTHIGDPAYDAYLATEVDTAIGVLTARGARVALCTSPYFKRGEQANGRPWPQDDPARVDRLNQLIREAAKRHPGAVGLVDLNAKLSADGHFTRTISGVQVRAADGVHLTPTGGRWLAPWLLPQVKALVGVGP
jgi:peptidoglycan/LPS O-acetylase OafA/YrhL